MSRLKAQVEALGNYASKLTKQPDFDMFWEKTLEITRKQPLNLTKTKVTYPNPNIDVYNVTYNGFDETVIHGIFIVPKIEKGESVPCLINYHGYEGNKGHVSKFMHWVSMGVAVLSIDCRNQNGDTGDARAYTCGASEGVVAMGLLDPNEYYYRAVYMDCVKAIDFAAAQPEITKDNIILHGASQGGALGVAVSALDSRPCLALVDVPSNSNIESRVEGETGSYRKIADYLRHHPLAVDTVYKTLSYFDTMNLADKIKCEVIASVALKDRTCPAQQFYATYNRIKSKKNIYIYPFNGHEGGGSEHVEVKLKHLKKKLDAMNVTENNNC
jgi:cephalosporin-C deacetylase